MDQYTASLARACLGFSGIETFYTENLPEGLRLPCLYFPPAESDPASWALDSFEASYSIYANIFAPTRNEAYGYAERIVCGILLERCRIPIYRQDGSESGEVLKLDKPAARIIDEGAAQVSLRYRLHVPYSTDEAELVQHYYIKNKHYD